MGFSHHWSSPTTIPTEAWTRICESTAYLLEAFEQETKRKLPHTVTPESEVIYIAPGLELEHLAIFQNANRRGSCKTLYMPFDRLVCAILAVVARNWPNFQVTSDGDQAHWRPHLAWASEILGSDIPMPPTIQPPHNPT